VNNLPKVVTQRCPEQDWNPRPTDRESNALTVAPPRHLPPPFKIVAQKYSPNDVSINFSVHVRYAARPSVVCL